MAEKSGKILLVDDNKSILSALELLLAREFEEISTLTNPNLIPAELKKKAYSVVLLDMNFTAGVNTGNEGIYWLGRIKEACPELSVVMITAYGDVDTAVRALKAGASDFVLKPWDNEKLLATLKVASELSISKRELTELREKELELKREFNRPQASIIGQSEGMIRVMTLVRKVAKTDANVLITGENGTGKELIAQEIHRLSARSKELLVTLDIASLPESLFESELFGHIKGSFTDARESRKGKFEVAHKGSLFLDEIGNLPFHLQAKLLSAIESRTITRIGSNSPVNIDIRLICATNRDLDMLVSEGLFREDLLYRINTIHIELPALRNRGEDVIKLAEHFLRRYAIKYNKPEIRISRNALDKLMAHTWPGNVRELQNTIEKSVILSETDIIKHEDLFLRPQPKPADTATTITISEMEERLIMAAIERNGGSFTAAAAELGITRQTLYNKLKKNRKND
jgi:DNA-binding NtrC family response regulator